MSIKLNSIPTLVESPFIIAEIGGITFGSYNKDGYNGYDGALKVTYPNFMKSMSVVKVNGTVNMYTLSFVYQVRPGEDPNLLDRIFSKASNDRRIILKYGDWNAPSYIYKEEKALITSITSSLDMNSSQITYTLNCTSDAIGLGSSLFTFPAKEAKPSDVIIDVVTSVKYGLNKVFTGMSSISKILQNNLIKTNDKKVSLSAQKDVSPLDYLGYLVNCMINQTANGIGLSSSKYFMTIHDDYTNELGGTYFKINEVSTNTNDINDSDVYEIDVNYPGDNFVTQFSLTNDQSWAILFDYNEKISLEQYSYITDEDGTTKTVYSPPMMRSNLTGQVSPAKSSWWTQMTQFPIQATLTIKGLTRPSILMTHVKLNVLFNGGIKHISSGLYVITKQQDTIDESGYRTTLNLLRIGGD